MIGIIDVGGGLRDAYGAGVLDRCIDGEINFPYCIGVSAGSANLAAYLAKQRGRNYRFYTEYIFHKEYMSLENVFKTGSYLGLDYLYSTLSNEGGADPLDFDAIKNSGAKFLVTATDAETGKPVYFDFLKSKRNDYWCLKASCCLPIACKAYEVEGKKYFDGGISDPVPIKKAFSDGCDKVVVLLTRPLDYKKSHRVPARVYNILMRSHPNSAAVMDDCIDSYNESVDELIRLQEEGRALVIAPDDCCGVNTLSKNTEAIDRLYRKGYEDGEKIIKFFAENKNAV